MGALEVVRKEERSPSRNLSKLYEEIDVAETLSNLTGKWIKRVTADSASLATAEVVSTTNLA